MRIAGSLLRFDDKFTLMSDQPATGWFSSSKKSPERLKLSLPIVLFGDVTGSACDPEAVSSWFNDLAWPKAGSEVARRLTNPGALCESSVLVSFS
jgi:hypothetical protein